MKSLRQPAILIFLLLWAGCRPANKSATMNAFSSKIIDWQGHRGARGLLPENSVPAFLKALEYPVTTLELDVVISRDRQVVVSHEPWMSGTICSLPGGAAVPEEEAEGRYNLFQMDYEEIRAFDCGSRGNARFPDQKPAPVHKPLLQEVVEAVERYCRENQRPIPGYNIEIKSNTAWDGKWAPPPPEFARLVVEKVEALGITARSCIQSFDERSLREVKALAPAMTTALLVENYRGVAANVEALGYVPEIYSPYYRLVNAQVVDTVHEQGMKLIPWTVNEVAVMRSLLDLGVDGIITDYPDRISAAAGQ